VSDLDLFVAALAALDRGAAVVLATVIGAQGSTPRHLGARMLVVGDGAEASTIGTIGGGKIEQVVTAAAREVLAGAAPRVVRAHLVRDLAMCCGGAMAVALTPLGDSRAAVAELAAARGPRVLATPLDGGPLVVRPPRAGDPPSHRPTLVGEVLLERLGGGGRAILFGLGHVGRAVGALLASLDFAVVACDDGETGATEAPVGWGEVLESFDPAEVERRLGGFGVDDHVLILTRDHAIDQRLLEQLIGHDRLGYLGMIGSRGKVGRFKKRLEARGLLDGAAGEARWARLRSPVGLELGAETPMEIAVAIAAELITRRRRGDAPVAIAAREAGDGA
jgi:xanthine dehydrogenase accessory factor